MASFALFALIFLGSAQVEAASSHVHGLVLAIDASKGSVTIRHDAFGGMPAMTMPFILSDRRSLAKVRVGNGIEGDVDTTREPWILSNVHVSGRQSITGNSVFRTSKRLAVGDAVSATPFIDQDGKPFTIGSLRGSYAVMAFIYTRCKDPRMCPLISAKFAQLQRRLPANVQLLEVSLDPDFDRPSVLRAYAKTFGADFTRWKLLTGDPNAVLDFAAEFGLSAFADPSVGLIHNESTVLIDPQGKILETITENSWTADGIVATLEHEQHGSGNPLARRELWISKAAVAVCGNSVAGFSGLADVVIVMTILGAGGWLTYRLARGIARGST